MGFNTDLFTSEPPASCICAVCHDVLKGASSLNCGHTFCDECIKSVFESDPKCPNCRADITATGPHPNFVVRDLINALTIRCPDGGMECNWTGRVDALANHGSACIYKTIECDVEGCTHTCARKDMGDHLSDMDVKLRHMELKYDKKLKDMEIKYERKFAEQKTMEILIKEKLKRNSKKLTECENRLQEMEGGNGADGRRGAIRQRPMVEGEGAQRNVRARQEIPTSTQMVVEGCGIDAINGVYSRDGEHDNVPKYIRRAQYNGREVEFSLYRTPLFDGTRRWYISIVPAGLSPGTTRDIDFYAEARASTSGDFPQRNGWFFVRSGAGPPPTAVYSRQRRSHG